MGGILWHTQGSGKTLTMVWLAKWILTHWAELNARVLIVTDRDELDEQIEKHSLVWMRILLVPRAVKIC